MVHIDCLYCKKNLGHQSCEKYELILEGAFNKCADFIGISPDDYKKKDKQGIDSIYFDGIEDPDTFEIESYVEWIKLHPVEAFFCNIKNAIEEKFSKKDKRLKATEE